MADVCMIPGGGTFRFEDYYIIPKSIEFFVLTRPMLFLLLASVFVAGFALAFIWVHTRVERELYSDEENSSEVT